MAALLAEDRTALGRKRDPKARSSDAAQPLSEEAAFDALEITAVAGSEFSGPTLFEEIEPESSRIERVTSAESEFDRLEVTAVGDSKREAVSSKTPPPMPGTPGGAESKGQAGGRRKQHPTPGGQRIAALVAQTRIRTGQFDLLGSQGANEGRAASGGQIDKASAGAPPAGSAGPPTGYPEQKSPGLSGTLLGFSAPDPSLYRSKDWKGSAPADGPSGQVGQGRGVGFSLADEVEPTERNAAGHAYVDSARVSGGFDASDELKRRPRGAIWIVVATALIVLAVGVIFTRYRKSGDRKAKAPVAMPVSEPASPPTIQQLPGSPTSPTETNAPGTASREPSAAPSTEGAATGPASPQQPSRPQVPGTTATAAPSEQPPPTAGSGSAAQPPAGESAGTEEASARETRNEGQSEAEKASSGEGSSPDSKRKLRRAERRRAAEARRAGKRKEKAPKNGSPRGSSTAGVSTTTTERPKPRPASNEDPDATLPLTGR